MFSKKSKRRIDVNSVSLVDLKAEIARRQIDVKNKATVLPNGCSVITAQSFGSDSRPIFKKVAEPKKEILTPSDLDESNICTTELSQLERSRKTLEAKAKLYDALKQAAVEGKCPSHPDEDIAPLVDFERKAMEMPPEWHNTKEYVNSSDESDCEREKYKRSQNSEPVSIPDGPITYAHLRQGEVRDHGVGFYAFSVDAEQRASELASLRELRKATEQARVRADKTRANRDIQMGKRLAKLRARKGLPDVATAAAQCLGELSPVSTPSDAIPDAEPSYSGVGASDLSLGSDDLDIASMLRRLRDEAEVRTAELESTANVPPPNYVSESRPRFLADNKKPAREWDRGKSLISSNIFIDRENRDSEFAPPFIY